MAGVQVRRVNLEVQGRHPAWAFRSDVSGEMAGVQVRLLNLQQGFWCFLEMLLIFPIFEIFENAARIVLLDKRVLLKLVYF